MVMDAAEKLEPLCYGGEELLESATVDGGAIGITSHRVLVLTPEGAGARFHAVDRPNATGVSTRTTGPRGHRNRAIVAGIIGGGLLVTGAAIDFGGLSQSVDAPTGEGLGGLLGLVFAILGAIGRFDDALRILGLLALLAALGFTAWYLWKAGWVIEIDVAGADSVRIPISRDQMAVVDRLKACLADDRAGDAADPTSMAPG